MRKRGNVAPNGGNEGGNTLRPEDAQRARELADTLDRVVGEAMAREEMLTVNPITYADIAALLRRLAGEAPPAALAAHLAGTETSRG